MKNLKHNNVLLLKVCDYDQVSSLEYFLRRLPIVRINNTTNPPCSWVCASRKITVVIFVHRGRGPSFFRSRSSISTQQTSSWRTLPSVDHFLEVDYFIEKCLSNLRNVACTFMQTKNSVQMRNSTLKTHDSKNTQISTYALCGFLQIS